MASSSSSSSVLLFFGCSGCRILTAKLVAVFGKAMSTSLSFAFLAFEAHGLSVVDLVIFAVDVGIGPNSNTRVDP